MDYPPWCMPGPHFVHRDKILVSGNNNNVCSYELFGENTENELGIEVKLFNLYPHWSNIVQSYIFVKSLVRLDIYKKAGVVRKPNEWGWKLKKWQVLDFHLREIDYLWSKIHKAEHDITVLARDLGKINEMMQSLLDYVHRQDICMELNQMLQHIPDEPDQPRSLQQLNWVEQKRSIKKLVAPSNKIDDILEVMTQAKDTICSMIGSYKPDQMEQGQSSKAATYDAISASVEQWVEQIKALPNCSKFKNMPVRHFEMFEYLCKGVVCTNGFLLIRPNV